ncbi:RluA family pseudouridine synthase [Parvularcula marina]|uniref:RluA family pseudouridine synthase n=1 Tax=Parvularcula marina TaxID=2292771 RepID=UPI003515E04F
MSGVQNITVKEADSGQRLDRWFKQHFPALGHGQLQKLLRKGQVRVDGGRAKADRRIEAGEVIRIPPLEEKAARPPKTKSAPDAEDKAFIRSLVLFEDKDILVLNKPFGLAVQGGAKTTRHIDGMLGAFGEGEDRPRLVHRLDRDTGGVLVLAKSRKSAAFLMEAFQKHRVLKTYWALTSGVPQPDKGRIDMALEKSGAEGREKMRGTKDGKKALTDYQVVETAGQKAAFVALRPHTGRTHQIRVHLSALNTPIVGDRKYGGEHAVMEGLAHKMHLFCREMIVPRPGGRPVTLTAPLTGHMDETWKLFSFEQPVAMEWPDE